MNLQDKIKKYEGEGWTYEHEFRLTVGGNTLVQIMALTKGNEYIKIDNGKIYTPKKIMSDEQYALLNFIYTFSEAAELWGLGESTLRKARFDGRFQEGEIRQSGSTWLVTSQAMERLYGSR
jgi:hypothetical protein